MANENVVTADLKGGWSCVTAPLWQWDYGQVLEITGIDDLPSSFVAHCANRWDGSSQTVLGSNGRLSIPNDLLTSGEPVYVWIILTADGTDGETRYKITIPVNRRAAPTDYPTTAQQSAITQAINALNTAAANAAAEVAAELVDPTLTVSGKAADAAKTGEELSNLKNALNVLNLCPGDFVQGAYQPNSTLAPPSSDLYGKRISFASKIKYKAGSSIFFDMGSDCGVAGRVFDLKPGTTQTSVQDFSADWVTGKGLWTMTHDGYITINIRYNSNALITPADYNKTILVQNGDTSIADLISNIQGDVSSLFNGGTITNTTLSNEDFKQGYYLATSIFDTEGPFAAKRIGLESPIKCVPGTKVSYAMANNQQLGIKVYENPPGTSQSALQETSSWLTGTGSFDINFAGYLVVNVRVSGDAEIAPADFSSVIELPVFDCLTYIEDINDRIDELDSEISGVGNIPYYGEKIKLNAYNYNAVQVGSVSVGSHTPQSSAIYGDELFTFYTGGDSTKSKFSVYNLLTNTVSGIFYMDAEIPYLHCNSACFGKKQNNNDAYPVLYINSYLDAVGKGICFAVKITKSGTDYSAALVQKISLDFTEQTIWTGETMNPQTLAAGNWLVDTVGNYLIAYTTQGFDRTRFFLFALPDFTESEIVLSETDIIDYFDVAYIANIQDACLHNGMIYLTAGIDWGNYDQILRMYVINLNGRSIVSELRLEESVSIMRTEPEGIDYYNNALMLTTVTKRVMRLTF